jgi:hypothetical protein
MKFLARVPFWAWLLVLTFLCYAVWNPSDYCYYHMVKSTDVSGSTKLLLGVLLVIIFGIFIKATFSSLGRVGLGLYLLLIAVIIYFLADHDMLKADNIGTLGNLAPFLFALLLAIGSQGAKIYRAITGTGQVHIDGDVSHEAEIDDLDH